jgi:hypothetical protein
MRSVAQALRFIPTLFLPVRRYSLSHYLSNFRALHDAGAIDFDAVDLEGAPSVQFHRTVDLLIARDVYDGAIERLVSPAQPNRAALFSANSSRRFEIPSHRA